MTDEAQRERERLLSERQARQERRARELDESAGRSGMNVTSSGVQYVCRVVGRDPLSAYFLATTLCTNLKYGSNSDYRTYGSRVESCSFVSEHLAGQRR